MDIVTNKMIKYYEFMGEYNINPGYFRINFDNDPLTIEWEDGDVYSISLEQLDSLETVEITEDEWLLQQIK